MVIIDGSEVLDINVLIVTIFITLVPYGESTFATNTTSDVHVRWSILYGVELIKFFAFCLFVAFTCFFKVLVIEDFDEFSVEFIHGAVGFLGCFTDEVKTWVEFVVFTIFSANCSIWIPTCELFFLLFIEDITRRLVVVDPFLSHVPPRNFS